MAILQLVRNQSLKNFNSFGIDVKAHYFTDITAEAQLSILFDHDVFKDNALLVMGGGSNILFTKDFQGLIIKNSIKGIEVQEQDDHVMVTVGGGEVWNDFVQYCVIHGYAGVENLSLIPGTVGASPVQNIGAYGVELENVFHTCKGFDLETGTFKIFKKEDCAFNYRDSIFKTQLKGRFLITQVTFRLSKRPNFNISYGAIEEELARMGVQELSLAGVANAVSTIRVNKLPDPSTIGNAGSFFKNPIIPIATLQELQLEFPNIVYYPINVDSVKVAAGWLIEAAGFKGSRLGAVGTWKNQALVLVNHGGATGQEVYDFSEKIVQEVYKIFKIKLEREVNIF